MQKKLLTLFTLSPLHVGSGSSVGIVDLPIMRERHTQIPVIPGSSLKGVLADLWSSDYEKNKRGDLVRKAGSPAEILFGSQDDNNPKAGSLLIGEARVVLFPVRSLKGGFAWITSPLALSRLSRDISAKLQMPPSPTASECLCSDTVKMDGTQTVILEEYTVTAKCGGSFPVEWAREFTLMLPEETQKLADGRLVLVSDELFMHFCENACQISTRIKLNDEKGVVEKGALFTMEQVPSETLLAGVLHTSNEDSFKVLESKLASPDVGSVIQIGGDETIGLGLCKINLR
jgi:CRISPR-associated protein Cmr4